VTVLRGFTDGKVGEFGAGIDYFIGLIGNTRNL